MQWESTSSRHLAAILFTDIVGYTAMMQRSEADAVAAVRRHQHVLEQHVTTHEGKVYQYYGDGSLSIFHSATQAVRCALALQHDLQMEPIVPLRIGIHIGEIYTEGGKLFGDGVNIASRIESIGQAGTVFFSKDVYEKIKNHPSLQCRSIGTFSFKNVEDPIEVFALTNPEVQQPNLNAIEGKLKALRPRPILLRTWWMLALALLIGTILWYWQRDLHPDTAGDLRSIAVIPFDNLTEGDDAEYLSIGIAEDILTQLAQIHDLSVISRSSSMQYRQTGKSVRTIAKELGVHHILSGSVRKFDQHLRISIQLIDAPHDRLIWAADFDREFVDILNLQKDVALEVSQKLRIELSPDVQNRFRSRTNVDPEAYVYYQKGQELLLKTSGTREDIQKARHYFENAIAEDSSFHLAWVGLADSWIETLFWHREQDNNALPLARAAAEKAMSLDPGFGETYGVLGAINLMERNLVSAERNLRRSIELNPSYAFAYERLGWIELFKGHHQACIDLYHKAIQLDPLLTRIKGSLGSTYYFMGRFEEGLRLMEENLKFDPTDNLLLWTKAYNLAGAGRYREAISTLDKRTIGTGTNWIYTYCYAKSGNLQKAREILQYHQERRKHDHVPDFMMATQFAAVGEVDSALHYLNESIHAEGENWFVLGFKNDPMLDPLRDHPEFKRMIDELTGMFGLASAAMIKN